MKKTSSEQGFTLVELSIVMIIIGLLIGGIMKGQELVENTRIASVISQSKTVTSAFNTFYDVYHAVPGDMANAVSVLAGCSAASACIGGNGDFLLGIGLPTGPNEAEAWYDTPATISSENTQFWKHLALADLIGGIDPAAQTPDWGKTHPICSLGGGFHVRSSAAPVDLKHGSLNGITLILRNDIDGRWKCNDPGRDNCSVSPLVAWRIDLKMDDANATTGIAQAISAGGWANGCGISNKGINGPLGYAIEKTTKSCDIMFKVDN